MGRLGDRRLRVGSRQDAQVGQDWETGRPERVFKEAKGLTMGRISGQEVLSAGPRVMDVRS